MYPHCAFHNNNNDFIEVVMSDVRIIPSVREQVPVVYMKSIKLPLYISVGIIRDETMENKLGVNPQ